MGKIRDKFYDELYTTLNWAMKHEGLDEEEALRVRDEMNMDEQKDWLAQREVAADSAYQMWKEDQSDEMS